MVERYQLLSMHSALAINDIVHTILQHVKSSGTDLINVAMTCSALSGPALDILWSEQSSLSHLVMCLPQDTWEATEERTIVSHVCYLRLDRMMLTVLQFVEIYPRAATHRLGARQHQCVTYTQDCCQEAQLY